MQKVLAFPELRDKRKHKLFRRIMGTLMGICLMPFSKRGGQFELITHKLELDKLTEPLKILQLSDLHTNWYSSRKNITGWFDAASHEQVDLILITGDFFDYLHWQDDTFLLEQLGRLSAPLGVWAVRGNHDYDKGEAYLRHFEAKLSKLGIRVLFNEGVYVTDHVFLAGIDDIREGQPDLEKALLGYKHDGVCLLMSHVPDVIPLLTPEVDLCFCGHTHGGQVVLPFLGVTQTSSFYGKRYAAGWVHEPTKAYVSRGLGYSTIPIRFNCSGELTVFDLGPKPTLVKS